MTDDGERIAFIAECIARVEAYVAGGKDQFFGDGLVQDAVLRRLEILSDACSQLSEPLRSRHPDVPWHGISGFRNVLAHAYRTVDLAIAWDVVESGLPLLRGVIAAERSSTSAASKRSARPETAKQS